TFGDHDGCTPVLFIAGGPAVHCTGLSMSSIRCKTDTSGIITVIGISFFNYHSVPGIGTRAFGKQGRDPFLVILYDPVEQFPIMALRQANGIPVTVKHLPGISFPEYIRGLQA